jgi:hypothetical protein
MALFTICERAHLACTLESPTPPYVRMVLNGNWKLERIGNEYFVAGKYDTVICRDL